MKIENITIRKKNGYGQYLITGIVEGIEVSSHTTDSEAYDYLNDEEYPEKQSEAIAHCKWRLEEAYCNSLESDC